MIIRAFELTVFGVNCYVVKDGGEALIIDPGAVTPSLLAEISDATVKLIINTHGHCDHCGGNGELKKATGAPLVCHEADLPLLRSITVQGEMFGAPFPPSPDPDRFLEDGETITVGGLAFEVRHAPGHSPGHVVLAGNGVVFSGDVLFAGSIGRTDLMGGNYRQLMDSIRKTLLTLPDDAIVYPGHGPQTTIGEERRHNPFLASL